MYENKDRIGLRNKFLDELENKLSKMEGTFNFDIASANGILLEELYKFLQFMEKQTFIDTATEDEYIEKHAILFGVSRRLGTKATGEVTFTGKENTDVPKGTIVLNREGRKYKTLIDVTISSLGKIKVPIESLDSGNIGNCVAGEINAFEISNSNIYSVINEENIIGGYDKEPNESLITRAKEKVTRPAHSGNVYDYEQWAKEVEGVGKVLVLPLWNGNGTVKVLVANYNNDIADETLLNSVRERLERVDGRPIGADVTIESFKKKPLSINVSLILESGQILGNLENKIKVLIKTAIKEAKAIYVKDGKSILSINRLEKLILEQEGILDCSLRINDENSNINLTDEEIPVIQEVNVNEE